MFNRIDYSSSDWTECCKLAEAVAPHPRDYYLGLPEPALTLPKNVILFKRHGFDQKRGTEEHHRFLLIFCLKAKGAVIVDGRVAPLRPGCALLVTRTSFTITPGSQGPNCSGFS